jgi:hypothetical protein
MFTDQLTRAAAALPNKRWERTSFVVLSLHTASSSAGRAHVSGARIAGRFGRVHHDSARPIADTGSGHNIVATVFVEARSMYRDAGPVEMRPVGQLAVGRAIDAGGHGLPAIIPFLHVPALRPPVRSGFTLPRGARLWGGNGV